MFGNSSVVLSLQFDMASIDDQSQTLLSRNKRNLYTFLTAIYLNIKTQGQHNLGTYNSAGTPIKSLPNYYYLQPLNFQTINPKLYSGHSH